jgi:hypothetical protein
MADKVKMTKKEAGRRGGNATKEKHGPEYYKELSKKAKEKVQQVWQNFRESQKQSDQTEEQ